MDQNSKSKETEHSGVIMPRIRATPDGRVTTANAAIFLGVAPQTLRNWRTMGRGPKALSVAGKIFYRLADLQAMAKGEAA